MVQEETARTLILPTALINRHAGFIFIPLTSILGPWVMNEPRPAFETGWCNIQPWIVPSARPRLLLRHWANRWKLAESLPLPREYSDYLCEDSSLVGKLCWNHIVWQFSAWKEVTERTRNLIFSFSNLMHLRKWKKLHQDDLYSNSLRQLL